MRIPVYSHYISISIKYLLICGICTGCSGNVLQTCKWICVITFHTQGGLGVVCRRQKNCAPCRVLQFWVRRRDGFQLLKKYCEKYWENLILFDSRVNFHPQLRGVDFLSQVFSLVKPFNYAIDCEAQLCLPP